MTDKPKVIHGDRVEFTVNIQGHEIARARSSAPPVFMPAGPFEITMKLADDESSRAAYEFFADVAKHAEEDSKARKEACGCKRGEITATFANSNGSLTIAAKCDDCGNRFAFEECKPIDGGFSYLENGKRVEMPSSISETPLDFDTFKTPEE